MATRRTPADLVVLAADPYAVETAGPGDHVAVLGTWSAGHKADLDACTADIGCVHPQEHETIVTRGDVW